MYKISDEFIKLIEKKHGKLESGIDNRRKKFSCGESPERYIPGICAITIAICNSNCATQLFT